MKNFVLLICTALSSFSIQAQFYRADSSFGIDGKKALKPASGNSAFYDVELQADGKILSSGAIYNLNRDILVKRHLKNGSADASFGKGGTAEVDLGADEVIADMGMQADGKIVLCGSKSGTGIKQMAILTRLKSDGSLDNGFGDQGSVLLGSINGVSISDADFRNLLMQADGKILVTGWVYAANTEYRGIVQRYNSNGTLDMGFGMNGSQFIKFTSGSHNYCQGLSLLQDGRILVLGSAYFNTLAQRMTRLGPDGNIDSSFGVNGIASPVLSGFTYVTPQWISEVPGGKFLTLGYAYTGSVQKIYITRYFANGQPDATYGTNGMSMFALSTKNNYAYNGQLHPNGDCSFPAESFTATGSMASIIRVDSLGKPSTSFGTNGVSSFALADEAYGDAIIADGDSLYIVGGVNMQAERFFRGYVLKVDQKGALLQNFGDNGVSKTAAGLSGASAANILPGINGQVYITGTLDQLNKDQFVARIDANGQPVQSYGTNGIALFDLQKDETLKDAIQLADGSILMASISGFQSINFTAPVVTLGGATHYSLSVIDSNGRKGLQKNFTITSLQFPSVKKVCQDHNGKFIALTSSSLPTTARFFLMRHNADLSVDNTYGTNGRIEMLGRTTSNFTALGDMQIAPDNDVVVLNWFSSSFSTPYAHFTLKKYKEDGKLDLNFGMSGVYNTADTVGKDPSGASHLWKFNNGYYVDYIKDGLSKIVHVGFNGKVSIFGTAVLDSVRVSDMKQLPGGSFLILCSKGGEVIIYHYFADGKRDLNFNGKGTLRAAPFMDGSLRGMVLNPDRSIIVYHQIQVNDEDAFIGMSKYTYGNTGNTSRMEDIRISGIRVYPNPFIQDVTLDISGMRTPAACFKFILMDMNGRMLPVQASYSNDTQVHIECTTNLPAGIYILAGTGDHHEQVRVKLIKN